MHRCNSFSMGFFYAVISLIAAMFSSGVSAADKPSAFDTISGLAGTWVSTAPSKPNVKPMTTVFKVTSGQSAVVETMGPGTAYEMVNVYTRDGEGATVTHYCAMGNQPRMKLVSAENGVLKFECVDGGNIKSRNDSHMDSLEITSKGDQLIEKWQDYADGKPGSIMTFEYKREK
jgi:hypothetical protein